MIRLNLTAEGKTEQQFASDVLTPHLADFGVYLKKPRLASLGKKKGRVHRGGMDRYLAVKNDIQRWMKQDKDADVRFTTMFDLYALPTDFPGRRESEEIHDPYKKVAALERAFQEDLDDSRFIPYIQLHEFEALLLAKPEAVGTYYPEQSKPVERLVKLCEDYDTPEKIDEGQHTAPSKRIIKELPEYAPAKATAGPIIANSIGLPTMRDKCPHFNEWLTTLEQLNNS